MHADRERASAGRKIPRLAPECDLTGLPLSPAEGFLLSRVDGRTDVETLRQLACLPATEVDRCLDRWLADGVLVFDPETDTGASGRTPSAAPPSREPAPAQKAESPVAAQIDPSLAIDVEAQKAILAFEATLDGSYTQILGLPDDSDPRSVKRAYFRLAKEFHPDRYFGRDIGPYEERLERIFCKIVEAYELLTDPMARAEVQRSLGDASAEESSTAAGDQAADDTAQVARPRPRTPRPFSVFPRVLAARRAKAKSFFEAGMTAFAEAHWLEAAASVRLAIAFDPANEVYRGRFGEVQRKAHETRAAQLLKEAEGAMSFRDHSEAQKLYEEALSYRPYDPELNHTVARMTWLVGNDMRAAKEYAMRACEREPENGLYHRTLGQIYKAAGLTANARRELKHAIRLDPEDREARTELRSLGRG